MHEQPRTPIVLNPISPEHRCYRTGRCSTAEKTEQTICGAGCACHINSERCDVPDGCHKTHRAEQIKTGSKIMCARGLCLRCEQITAEAISALPRDYVELHLALERGNVGLVELVAATKDLPAALRVNVAALSAEMVRVAAVWAEPVADRMGIDWDTQDMACARPGFTLQRAANLLSRGLSVMLALQDEPVQAWADNGWYHTHESADGIDGALALLHLHQVTRSALGQTRLVHELPAPCPHCNAMALVRNDGDDNVHCQRCRLQWPEDDYRRLTLVIAADYSGSQVAAPRSGFRSTAEGTVSRPVTQELLVR